MGPGSVLLLEGREHLARRQLMLPPFHGERMRSYEATIREIAERELDSWSARSAFALHPRMQAITLEVILRAVFGVTDPARDERLRERLPLLLGDTASPALQFRVLLSRRLGRGDPLGPARAARGDRRAAARRDRRAPRPIRIPPTRARGHPLAARRGPLRGRHAR